jgi:hypothetical protein
MVPIRVTEGRLLLDYDSAVALALPIAVGGHRRAIDGSGSPPEDTRYFETLA